MQITVFCPPEPRVGAFVYRNAGKVYIITTKQHCLGERERGLYSLGERGRGVCCCFLVLHMLFLENGEQTKRKMFVTMFLNYRRNQIA